MTLDGGNEEKEENDPDMPPLHVWNYELGKYGGVYKEIKVGDNGDPTGGRRRWWG